MSHVNRILQLYKLLKEFILRSHTHRMV